MRLFRTPHCRSPRQHGSPLSELPCVSAHHAAIGTLKGGTLQTPGDISLLSAVQARQHLPGVIRTTEHACRPGGSGGPGEQNTFFGSAQSYGTQSDDDHLLFRVATTARGGFGVGTAPGGGHLTSSALDKALFGNLDP